jgi:hypothetical protein
VKLLLDEQISGKIAERLRDRGHDVIAATDDLSLRGLRDPTSSRWLSSKPEP